MRTQFKLIILLFVFLTFKTNAQQLSGKVVEIDDNKKEAPLPFANVYWMEKQLSTITNENGEFKINYPDSMPAFLIVSMVGYLPDTIKIKQKIDQRVNVYLKNANVLKDVEIVGKKRSDSYSVIFPINVQTISKKELLKAACCNLSESFETNASVDVNYTDAVSGAKQIQMLGLDGVYAQILSENMPFIRGLSSAYGLNYMPGTWIDNIYITKGTGSVVNGYESISGQIQLELIEPMDAEKLFINGYFNHQLRHELNLHLSNKFNDRVASLLMVHASEFLNKIDHNDDDFLDLPLYKQLNVLNRWHFTNNKNYEGQIGLRAMLEERWGGQTRFNYDKDYGTTNAYGIGIDTKQFDFFTKNGILFPATPAKSIGTMLSGRYHDQKTFFGNKKYNGLQQSIYGNFIYQNAFKKEFHSYKVGASVIIDDYKESLNDSGFTRQDIVPGTFYEYTYNNLKKHSLVVGVRGDYHLTHGFFFNPRVHYKLIVKEGSAVRLSAGKGMRTANILSENASIFANSRVIRIASDLKPENALNYGISFVHNFKLFNNDASLNIDYFRTDFINQVVVDMENPREINYYNLKGVSYSNTAQIDFTFSPFKRFDIKTAYKFYDVRTTYSGTTKDKPFLPKHRALLNLAYATNFEKWKFDYTLKWFGITRLPDTYQNPLNYRIPEYSDAYFIMNAQITKRFKHFEAYLGGENLTGYMLHDAIIGYDDPFGSFFDASMIWAPMMDLTIYGGFRFSIK